MQAGGRAPAPLCWLLVSASGRFSQSDHQRCACSHRLGPNPSSNPEMGGRVSAWASIRSAAPSAGPATQASLDQQGVEGYWDYWELLIFSGGSGRSMWTQMVSLSGLVWEGVVLMEQPSGGCD